MQGGKRRVADGRIDCGTPGPLLYHIARTAYFSLALGHRAETAWHRMLLGDRMDLVDLLDLFGAQGIPAHLVHLHRCSAVVEDT